MNELGNSYNPKPQTMKNTCQILWVWMEMRKALMLANASSDLKQDLRFSKIKCGSPKKSS